MKDKLGEGAFGVVYEVVKKATKESFAVKMVDLSHSDKATVDRELEMLRTVAHKTCVACIDTYEDNCFTYIVMPKFSGGDMIDGLQLHLRKKGKIPEEAYLHLVR